MRGWHIGTIAGISIEIHFTWIIIFLLFLVSLSTGHFPRMAPAAPRWLHWLAGLVATAMFFASLILHELAHSLVARRTGLRVERITLFIFGGLAELRQEPRSAADEFAIAIVGPLTSAATGAVFWFLSRLIPPIAAPLVLLHEALFYVAVANFFLAAFNSVPAFPLDGGRVVRSILWAVWHSFSRATAAAATLGKLFGYTMGGIGLWLAFGPAHSLLDGLWLVFLGWLLAAAAEQAHQRARIDRVLEDVPVGDLMTSPAIVVPATLTLADFVATYDFPSRACYPVVRDGRVVGLFHRTALRHVPMARWPFTQVADLMEPLDFEAMVIRVNEPAAKALEKMLTTGRKRLMVTGPDNRLLGMISYSDIAYLFMWPRRHLSQRLLRK